MGRQQAEARTRTTAAPEAVYALLRDGATWPTWSPIDTFDLERPGDADPEGLCAIRVLRTGRYTMREEIVELVPDRRFSYVLLSGLALRGYRADIDIEPEGTGTAIRWHSSFVAKVPGTGWLYRRQLTKILGRFVEGLAEHSRQGVPAGRDAI